MPNLHATLALLALFLPFSLAQYPVIEDREGFQVDMEPFWIESDLDDTNPTPLDVQGYFRQEMQTNLPNILGVVLQKYEDADLQSTASSRAFYTGIAVFQGPPFRTNHEVYQGQMDTLTSIRAAKSYLAVHDAQLGIPEWFNATALATDEKVELTQATDAIVDQNVNKNNSNGISLVGLVTGLAIGFVLGACTMFIVMVSQKHFQNRPSAPMTPRRNGTRHKRKQSDTVDYDLDLAIQEHPAEEESNSSNSSDNGNESPEEVFSDEEAQKPLTNSPAILRTDMDGSVGDLTPRKRRPSHHRRWKSTAFQSPSSVMDGLFLPSTPTSKSPSLKQKNHRRANSLADSNHRRSNSLADAFHKLGATNRRDSMQDLLASVDMAELMNDQGDGFHF